MKLSVHDRIQIPSILPTEGDYITLCLKKGILEKTVLTDKEIEEWEIKSVDNTITWNVDKCEDKDTEYTEAEINMIKKQLRELDEGKKLSDNTFKLYQLFLS